MYTSLGILTLEGSPHHATDSVVRWRGGGCPSRVKMSRPACIGVRIREIVTSTLSNSSCFFYPLVFFEFKNFCRAPYTWPHFGAISVSLEAIAFFRDRRHIQNLENTDKLKYLMEKSNKNERRTDFQISSTLLT